MPSNDGSPEPRRSSPQEAAFQELVQLTEELGLYDAPPVKHGPDCIPDPHCFRCGRDAEVCYEGQYGHPGDFWQTGTAYALHEEGTYNTETNHFACDECYIAIGMPSTPYGWVAP